MRQCKNYTILAIIVAGAIIKLYFLSELGWYFHVVAFLGSIPLVMGSWYLFSKIDSWLNRKMPYEKGIARRIAMQIGIGLALVLSLRVIFYYFIDENELFRHWRVFAFQPDRFHRLFILIIDIMAVALINAVLVGRHFIFAWQESMTREANLQRMGAEVQYDNLKNQVNPHFLFNSFTTLNSLIHEDADLASQYLQHMSKVYRYMLQHHNNDVVSLEEELDFLQNYLFIMDMRFGKQLEVHNQLAEQRQGFIVPITLQMLVENALKHNILTQSKPLKLSLYKQDDYLVVENNLQPKNIVETSNRLGLQHMRRLYSYLTTKPVKVLKTEQHFSVHIPLLSHP